MARAATVAAVAAACVLALAAGAGQAPASWERERELGIGGINNPRMNGTKWKDGKGKVAEQKQSSAKKDALESSKKKKQNRKKKRKRTVHTIGLVRSQCNDALVTVCARARCECAKLTDQSSKPLVSRSRSRGQWNGKIIVHRSSNQQLATGVSVSGLNHRA
ncbi:hypothetical protein [Oryza sativa Japonica Group]|uniref:Uncharacterized protein n=1 Tax=Oryza sativa subsp. japonica TaxID=39947 RepID=Q5ZBJ8_ORYSJ|nr:hypothetical protein [Oryza sativa Japonica Group]BAD53078.1 hypothetical protein [Oryza sativa Japonica Group]